MSQTLHQQLVELRGRAKAWLATGYAEGFLPWHGICGALRLDPLDRAPFDDLMSQWPGHSGDKTYPVPHPTRGPERAFDIDNLHEMWDSQHEYARNRWALLDWLIEQTASEADQ